MVDQSEGSGGPSGLSTAAFALPDRYPILDYRALASLGDHQRRTQYSVRFWLDYVARCQDLARNAGVSVRELDKALWQDSLESDSPRS